MNKPQHVCILGCGRSGTSIFGELFKALPTYTYLSEPDLGTLNKTDFHQPVAIKVPRPGPEDTTSPGLPFLWPDFMQLFPSPPVLFWQVRHPLDTICSLKIGIARNWGHHPRPHDWQSWLSKPLEQQCAHHWNYLNTTGYLQIKEKANISHFEDLVADPLQHARRCLELAGMKFEEVRGEVATWAQRVQDANNEKFVEAECSRPYSTKDHKRKVGRWKENLSLEEVINVLPLIEEGAEHFGYKLPGLEETADLH